jgi:glycosyltransferase involved in cell wall biosynthesis
MNLKYRLQKAWQSLINEGPVVFGRKLMRFIPWVFRRTYAEISPYLPEALRARGVRYNDQYQFLSSPVFQINSHDIARSKQVQTQPKPQRITTATWFVPYFDHLHYGGNYTIFRFMAGMAEQGVKPRIVIYDRPLFDHKAMKADIVRNFPVLKDAELKVIDLKKDKIEDLPPTDIAFCTIWMSAYCLLRFNQTKRKYYFAQDYEPLFYEGGATYALAESTYRFGFYGIVNTPGLLRAINLRHGMEGISFVPAVDSRYFPPEKPRNNKHVKIFFYARPGAPRNAFELGVLIIQQLIKRYGDKIEIVTAGADWKSKEFGLNGLITNLGRLNGIDEVSKLYRTCDIGFVYMLSKHPSYQPFEFMASGMATVTNNNEDNLWFLKDGTNCLIAEPSPAAMAEKIGWLIDDDILRDKIQVGGQTAVTADWQLQIDTIWNDIKHSKR